MATVFLIGFPGCGKTTLGQATAKVLGCTFTDLDEYIEQKARLTVKEIYRIHGEEYFRRMESDALRELSLTHGIVACGGGTPCTSHNMELMNDVGLTVWLTTSEQRLISRLCLPEHRAKRPAITACTDEQIATYVHRLLAERTPHYAKAQLQFDSSRIETAEETVETAQRLAQILSPHLID